MQWEQQFPNLALKEFSVRVVSIDFGSEFQGLATLTANNFAAGRLYFFFFFQFATVSSLKLNAVCAELADMCLAHKIFLLFFLFFLEGGGGEEKGVNSMLLFGVPQ